MRRCCTTASSLRLATRTHGVPHGLQQTGQQRTLLAADQLGGERTPSVTQHQPVAMRHWKRTHHAKDAELAVTPTRSTAQLQTSADAGAASCDRCTDTCTREASACSL